MTIKIIYRVITRSDGISSLGEPPSLRCAAAGAEAAARIVCRWLQTLCSPSASAALRAVTMDSHRVIG